LRPVSAEIQSLADKFPAQGNRDFQAHCREDFFDNRANYRPIGHVDELAGDVRIPGQSGHPNSTAPRQLMTQTGTRDRYRTPAADIAKYYEGDERP
jgi:hypothetical protein